MILPCFVWNIRQKWNGHDLGIVQKPGLKNPDVDMICLTGSEEGFGLEYK